MSLRILSLHLMQVHATETHNILFMFLFFSFFQYCAISIYLGNVIKIKKKKKKIN